MTFSLFFFLKWILTIFIFHYFIYKSYINVIIGSSNDDESVPSSTSNDTSQDVDFLIAENTVASLKPVIESDITTDSGISELTPLLIQETGSIADVSLISEPSSPKGPEPTAESIGLKESIEDCMRILEPTSKFSF